MWAGGSYLRIIARDRRPRPAGALAPALLAIGVAGAAATGQDPPVRAGEEAFTLDDDPGGAEETSPFDSLGQNLRLSLDVVSRFETTSRRGELEAMNAVGLDAYTVLSDDRGDIGTIVLQPYVVRRDNAYARPIEVDQDDAFSIELHDFYVNLTRWGRGRTNVKVGHFDVPFGLEPNLDTHFTVRQLTPLHDAGFKKDWGLSLNGVLPDFDYEVSATSGTGLDLTGRSRDPYLFAARIGTPSDRNLTLGLSALYGEVIDDHGTHRYDEGNPAGEPTEEGRFVRRWRVGGDATYVARQWTWRGQLSTGEDFDQAVLNGIAEVSWTTVDETLTFYLQGVYLGQDGFLGWEDDVQTRLGFRWPITEALTLSGQWIHEFDRYARELEGVHLKEDTYTVQLRVRF